MKKYLSFFLFSVLALLPIVAAQDLYPGDVDIATLALLGGVLAMIAVAISIVFYVYWALAWMTIAQKLKYKKAWLAWIPIAQLFLIPILAKKRWTWGFIFLVPIANAVFFFIWTWSIFEKRKYPGWLSLLPLAAILPIIGWIGAVAYLVVLGFVAWKDK